MVVVYGIDLWHFDYDGGDFVCCCRDRCTRGGGGDDDDGQGLLQLLFVQFSW